MFKNFVRKRRRLGDNVEKFGRAGQATSDNIIWRILFACWKIKPTDKHSGYKILIVFAMLQWLYERASMLSLYVRYWSCWYG